MDRTGIIVVTACVILLGFWFVQEQKYASQRFQQQTATNMVATSRQRQNSHCRSHDTKCFARFFIRHKHP